MSKFLYQEPLILASASPIRLKLLNSLGLTFSVIPSTCNEDELKASFHSKNVTELGYLLAKEKALEVSHRNPEDYVIAADQLCVIGDRLLDKPLNHETAVAHLNLLSGKDHQQIACLCVAKKGQIIWAHHETATLSMRTLNNATIDTYLHTEKPYHSCGAYQFESKGKWLFDTLKGSEDTVLGLPLLPLIKALTDLEIVRF